MKKEDSIGETGFMSYRIESNDWICFIFEADDEWFWVNLEYLNMTLCKKRSLYLGSRGKLPSTYFKCDQFDGLTNLLVLPVGFEPTMGLASYGLKDRCYRPD